jgi:hypothetical protein
MFEHEKIKAFCRHGKCMKVLHCRGLPMVMMIEKKTTRRQGTIRCNIMAKKSFREEQLENKSMKSSSPCWKAQEKVCHLIIIQMKKIFDIKLAENFNLYTLIGNKKNEWQEKFKVNRGCRNSCFKQYTRRGNH